MRNILTGETAGMLAVLVAAALTPASLTAAGVPDVPHNAPPSRHVCEDPALTALLPPPAPSRPRPSAPYDPLRKFDRAVDLGVGHLQPNGANTGDADWWSRLTLPLFRLPGGDVTGWMVNGWMITGAAAQPFTSSGLVETGYEVPTVIVFEQRPERPDGWLRLRVDRDPDGVRWTHGCFFDQTTPHLTFEAWQDRFLDRKTWSFYFREAVPHALRRGPSATAERIAWIPSEMRRYAMYPIAVEGDWMRVRVVQPSDYCPEPETPRGEVIEGWVRWREPSGNPWVWYSTRGC